jgi:peptidoglycan hydrolase FlgJ
MDLHLDPRLTLSTARPTVVDKKSQDLATLKKQCQEFESLLLMEMVKGMRKTVPEGGLIETDNATELYRDMLDNETVRAAGKGKGLGLAEAMYKQMAPLIENKK